MSIVHHHLILHGKTNIKLGKNPIKELKQFLIYLARDLDMNILIEPKVALSHQNAYTGIIVIVTSHITFHYWFDQKLLQLDIYSCKEFDVQKTISLLKDFWKIGEGKSIFINRELGKNFKIEPIDI